MDLWERLDLIQEVNKRFCTEYQTNNFLLYDFRYNFSYTFWSYFYLIKVNISLFFNWESKEEADYDTWVYGFAAINEEERTDWNVPIGSWDWEELATPRNIFDWQFGFLNSCNY